MTVSYYMAAAVVIATLALGGANSAIAAGEKSHKHNDHNHEAKHDDHDHGPKHGGQVIEVGHQSVELVVGTGNITFHITEEDKPIDLNGAAFKAILQTLDGVKVLPLSVDGNMLTAKWSGEIPTGSKIALSGKDSHGHTLQARFVTR